MLGAIAGDIIGSLYENFHTKRKDFRLLSPISFFTDDTVLTVAVAESRYDGVPELILKPIWRKMPVGYRKVVIDFSEKYGTARMAEQSILAGRQTE